MSVEQDDLAQTIATLLSVGRYPLFAAGALPLDARTLSYLANPLALALNRRTESAAAPTRILYAGNCTCSGGAGSCTIPHGPLDHPAQPCIATWVATVPAPAPSGDTGWTALAVIDMGEDGAAVATSFAEMGLDTAARYRVQDVWTGALVGVFDGHAAVPTQLRPHAAVLLQVTAVP